MKTIKIILFVFIWFLPQIVSSQVNPAINFYPLHVGDVWQYKIRYFPEAGKDTTFYMFKRVLTDTLLNNKRYYLIEQPPFTYNKFNTTERVCIRIDSTNGVVYKFLSEQTPEEQIDSLFCMSGSFFNHKLMCTDTTYTNVFSSLRFSKTIISPSSSNNGFHWKEAIGIGIFYQENWMAIVTAGGNEYNLVYAKINGEEYGTLMIREKETEIPLSFQLSQNYPNPFNPTTKIRFSIPTVETLHATSLQYVTLKVFDILGNKIATLVNEEKLPGSYEVMFDGSNLASGVYFYTLTAGNFSQTKKLLLIK